MFLHGDLYADFCHRDRWGVVLLLVHRLTAALCGCGRVEGEMSSAVLK
jgi:hypothetical protein